MKLYATLLLAGLYVAPAIAADITRITVTGSSTIAPAIAEVAKAFEKSHPSVRVDVQTGGSSRGIADVRQGIAQIGMVSRAMLDSEKDVQSALIAKDGIAIVVHKANPIQKLSRAQIVDIYAGKIKNWASVGGADLPITVISKAEGRSTLEIFSAYFGLSYRAIRPHIIVGDNQQEIQTVITNKGAIGYISIGSAEYETRNGAAIKLIALDGFHPSSENVLKGVYPVTRDLNLVFKKPLSRDVQQLVDFTLSPEGQKQIASQYFIPVSKSPVHP